jgi:hypothetical protein
MPSHKKAFPLLAPMIDEDRTATVYQWMCRNGLRHAGIDYRKSGNLPTPDEVSDYLGTLAHRHDVYPGLNDYKRMDQIERQIEDATRLVVGVFSVEYLEKCTERARNGYILGISKARALGTGGIRVSPHIEWLREHPDMGATEAGRAREITRQQVNRLRVKIAALDAQAVRDAQQADMDKFFPETNVDISTEELDQMFPMSVPTKPATTVRDKDQNHAPLPTQRDLSGSQHVRVQMPTPAPVTPSPDTILETAKVALLVA